MARKIQAISLPVGAALRGALYTVEGVRLLPNGSVLTAGIARALASTGQSQYILADSPDEVRELLGSQPQLAPNQGERPGAGFVTAGGTLAVEPGQLVEEHHADALRLGAFKLPDPGSPSRLRAAILSVADEIIVARHAIWEKLPKVVPGGSDSVTLAAENLPGWPEAAELASLRSIRVAGLRVVLSRFLAGVPVDGRSINELADELIALCSRYPTRFAELALNTPRRADYLPDHSLTVAVLSVGIACRLGWPRQWVRRAGVAGLLCDIGMALVPAEIRLAERSLDDAEVNRIRRHPQHSVVMLDGLDEIDAEIAQGIAQHHEREDGSGYPRGLKAGAICPLAKLIAVADGFAALTAPRPHRPTLLPADAMQATIEQISEGKLDRKSVRGLLELCGLYPVSSWVSLSDGSIGQVVGTGVTLVDRPIVRTTDGRTVILADMNPGDLSVLEAITPPDSAAAPPSNGGASSSAVAA